MAGYLERELAYGMPEPAQSTLWVVEFPFSTSVYHIYAEQFSPTFPKVPSRPRFTDGSNTYYPEITDIDGISATFYETSDYRVSQWLMKWRQLIVDAKGNYGAANRYKKKVTARLFARDNLNNASAVLVYSGVWPTDKSPFSLNYDDETGRLTVEVQFSTDSVEEEYAR